MATPTLSKHQLPGQLGDILVDVRAGTRRESVPTVVVLHGFKGFKDWGMFPPFADRLARAGFAVVSCNVSGSGVDDHGRFAHPERFGHNTFTTELGDIAAVLDALDRGALGIPRPSSVGVVGHSRGGGMAILTAAAKPRISTLVTWAAIGHVKRWPPEQIRLWREQGRIDVVNARTGEVLPMYLDTIDDVAAHADTTLDIDAAARRLTIPWLIIHGTADEAVPVAEAERLSTAAPTASPLLLPGAGHTFGATHPLGAMTPDLERVFASTVEFLGSHLS